MAHLDDSDNPHRVDKADVGLGDVDNFRTATVAETIEGMLNNRFVTPSGVRQLIASINTESVASHAARFDNPHHVNKDQVGLSNVPNFPVASIEQAKLGEIDSAFMTPQLTRMAITDQVGNSLTTHLGNKANPHGTTKAHVGLGLVENYQMATVEEAKAGLAKDRYVSPFLVAQYVQQTTGGAAAAHISDLNNPHQVTKEQVGLGNVDNLKTAVATDYELANNSAFATPGLTVDWVKAYIATLNISAQAIIPVPVTGTTEVEVGKHYRVMAGANLIFPAEEGEIRIIIDHTVDVSTGSVVAVAPPNEVFHTSAGDDATVTLRDVGLEYIYQRINGAWRLS
jgi:hypothetical protein